MAALVRARADDDGVAIFHEDGTRTWREVVAEAAVRAAWMRATLNPDLPPHVGIMLPNVPEFVFQIFGAALAGACIVGVNPTRRGADLERDVEHTNCQVVLTDSTYADLLPGATRIESRPWAEHDGAALSAADPDPSSTMLLLFTSGSTSAPKAARRTQGRLATSSTMGFGPDDVLYGPMPLFHGNALSSILFPGLAAGATIVLRDRFSASCWLDDVREHGVTFTSTVGRALGYVLATEPTEHDRDHRLRVVLAPEASPRDVSEFGKRFGVAVMAGYGSSEGGIALMPSRKPGSLGTAPRGADIAVVDESGNERETARFDDGGQLANAEAAIGELVRRDASNAFEGYWNNPEAEAERMRGGWFWSSDLAYRDADGVFWFAGRIGDWLRVDSENFATAPIERIIDRHPDVAAVAVIGVPDPLAGDQVLAAVEMRHGREFDPVAFAEFLSEQADLGTKWAPRFIRVSPALPLVGTGKLDKKPLKREAWLTDDDIWWRPTQSVPYARMTAIDRDALHDEFVAHDRLAAYPNP